MTLVSESGLYTMIMRSNKEEAKPFRKWVTGEVLPSIRKTGRYEVKQAIPDFSNPAEAARAWADAYEAKEKAQLALAIYSQLVAKAHGAPRMIRAGFRFLPLVAESFSFRPVVGESKPPFSTCGENRRAHLWA